MIMSDVRAHDVLKIIETSQIAYCVQVVIREFHLFVEMDEAVEQVEDHVE